MTPTYSTVETITIATADQMTFYSSTLPWFHATHWSQVITLEVNQWGSESASSVDHAEAVAFGIFHDDVVRVVISTGPIDNGRT